MRFLILAVISLLPSLAHAQLYTRGTFEISSTSFSISEAALSSRGQDSQILNLPTLEIGYAGTHSRFGDWSAFISGTAPAETGFSSNLIVADTKVGTAIIGYEPGARLGLRSSRRSESFEMFSSIGVEIGTKFSLETRNAIGRRESYVSSTQTAPFVELGLGYYYSDQLYISWQGKYTVYEDVSGASASLNNLDSISMSASIQWAF